MTAQDGHSADLLWDAEWHGVRVTTQTSRRGPSLASLASGRGSSLALTQGLSRLRSDLGWIWVPLLVFVTARGISIAMMMIAVDDQVALSPDVPHPGHHVFFDVPASPNFWEASTNWDAQWFRLIAERGYPDGLPMVDGEAAMSAWAFYPLYPMLVRLVMSVTGSPFIVAAPLVNLMCAFVGTLVLYRLAQRTGGTFVATIAILALHTHPASASFQVGYTEGLAFLLIILGLRYIYQERYGSLVLVGALLSLTRPIALVLAGVVALLMVVRTFRARRQRLPRPPVAKPLIAAALVAATMGLWPLFVAVGTGHADGFMQTQAAWPGNQVDLGLLGNWLIGGLILGQWLVLGAGGLILGLVVFGVTRAGARGWGSETRVWAVVYTLYLLLATRPVPSMIRYLLLVIAPVAAMPETLSPAAPSAQRGFQVAFPLLFCAVSLVGQYYWLDVFYAVRDGAQPYP